MKKKKFKKDQIVKNGGNVKIPLPMMDDRPVSTVGVQVSMTDNLTLEKPRITRDGQMVVDIFAARVGIQEYLGSELGLFDRGVVKVYRPEEEVFDRDSISTFAHRPITNDHPPVLVSPENYTKYANGFTGSDISRIDDKVRMQAVIADKVLIDAIQAGKRELSAGYTCNLEFVSGVTPDGETFDAIQRDVRINHVAVVDAGRAGKSCRIGDSNKDVDSMTTPTLKTVVVDGVSYQITDQGAEVIAKLQTQVADAKTALTDAETSHKEAVALKDKELGESAAKIKKLEDAAVTPEALDKLVADRAAVLDSVKKLGVTVDSTGKTPAEIRRAAVAAKLGDKAVEDRSDDYVEALFDSTTKDAPDAFRSAMIGDGNSGVTTGTNDANSAYDKMIADQADAWKDKESN